MNTTYFKGIAYMPTYDVALMVKKSISNEFPGARIIKYDRGWAVQVQRSGDYIGRNGRPSKENRS